MREHYIKITKHHYEAVLDGTKRAEIRNNDREYQKGDLLYLEEVEIEQPSGVPKHTGRVIKATASYVTNYLQKDGIVVISIVPLQEIGELTLDTGGQNGDGAAGTDGGPNAGSGEPAAAKHRKQPAQKRARKNNRRSR